LPCALGACLLALVSTFAVCWCTVPSIYEKWKTTPEEISAIIKERPSVRGMLFGYLTEYKVQKLLASDPRVTDMMRPDDHDRTQKADLIFGYKGHKVKVEVKSLQTNTVTHKGGIWRGKVQCDASDKRPIPLPDGSTVETTLLAVGEFDMLAAGLFHFGNEWRFSFARNGDLPRTSSGKYSAQQCQFLIKSMVAVSWPPVPPLYEDPFAILDSIV